MRIVTFCILMALAVSAVAQAPPQPRPGSSPQAFSPDPNGPRPIATRASVWIEELTWMEVRDYLRSGKTTVIIPTGGVEQNGPYLVTGKHNVILKATAEAVAQKLADALVAPIVAFVPEGTIEPPSDAMRYPGTISLEETTYQALLRDIARSYRAQGFRHIVFIGDSLQNQEGMKKVADELNRTWASGQTRVHYIPEYYNWPDRQRWLAQKGYAERDEGIHDELSATAIMLSVDPRSVRMDERVAARRFSINGVQLAPTEQTASLGRALVNHIAEQTAAAIKKARASSR